jgi:hypothetical protein
VLILIPWEEQVCTLWFRWDLETISWTTIHVNKRGSTLRLSDLLFSGLVQSDLRYSRAYSWCFGLCKSSASSVCIERFRKMLPDRWKQVDHGSRSRMSFQFEELISPAQREIKEHLNHACRRAFSSFHQGWSDLKLVESSLGKRDAPNIAWALKTRDFKCQTSSFALRVPEGLNSTANLMPWPDDFFRGRFENLITRIEDLCY